MWTFASKGKVSHSIFKSNAKKQPINKKIYIYRRELIKLNKYLWPLNNSYQNMHLIFRLVIYQMFKINVAHHIDI